MFLQLNPNTYIRPEHISAVDFTQSAARVYVVGVPNPYRVMAPDILSQLHQLVEGEPKADVQAAPALVDEQAAAPISGKVEKTTAKPRRKSA